MENLELKHTWVLPRNSKLIRFYKWLWEADESQINFCKLFWGMLFAIPNLLVRLVIFPFLLLEKVVSGILPEPAPLSEEEKAVKLLASLDRKRKRKNRAQHVLGLIEAGGVRVVWFFQWFWRWARYPFVVILGLIALGGMVLLFYSLVTAWWTIVWHVVAAVLGSIVVAVPFIFVLYLLGERGKLNWAPKFFDKLGLGVLLVVAGPFIFFFWVMKMGFISVKTNTCPKVELRD